MEYLTLGANGPRVSRVGFGCAAMGGYDYGKVDDAASVAAVHAALDDGVTLFDVADVYGLGHAESVLGQALRSAQRRDAVVATKVGVRWDDAGRTRRDLSPAWIRQAIHDSLTRLGLERVDLYQLHWPDPSIPLEDTMGAMLELKADGKIGHIGCCNFDAAMVEETARLGPIASGQLPYNVAERGSEAAIVRAATTAGVPTLAYNVLAHGLFSGKYDSNSVFLGTDLRTRSALFRRETLPRLLSLVDRMRAIGECHGHTPAQVSIRWVLQREGVAVALAGAKTASQIRETAGASDWSLTVEELADLERAYERLNSPIPSP